MKVVVAQLLVVVGLAFASVGTRPALAQQPSGRIALVIGDGAYARGPLPTAANDAGLVAQTLTAAGFDVTGARDLDGDSLRRAFRDFLDKANTAGPNAIAMVYVSGYALQFDGDNYLVPIDATLARDTDIPIQAVRVGDFLHALAAVPLQSRVVVLDGAYADPAVPSSDHVAPGLAIVDPDPGMLVAFNAAPGTAAPAPTGSYGVYGQALAEMMREGGVPVDEVFDRLRLRVNQTTRGAVVPWDVSTLTTPFLFLDRAPDAPSAASAEQSFAAVSKRPIRDFPVDEAYSVAVARDTFGAYTDFLAAYPQSLYARRVRALLAVRREALIWRQTVSRSTAPAFWTYLRRYPRGPHVYDCRRRLATLAVPLAPPAAFAPIDYDVPPPPEADYPIIEAPAVYFLDPDDVPPPPPPLYVLPPPPADFIVLPPPPPPIGPGFLPIPIPIPILLSRPIAQPGVIAPPRFIEGHYAQPQPFMTAPNGRLVAQPAPAVLPTTPPAAVPAPGVPRPQAAPPAPQPGVSSVVPGAGRPVGLGQPLPIPPATVARPTAVAPRLSPPTVPAPGQGAIRPTGGQGAAHPAGGPPVSVPAEVAPHPGVAPLIATPRGVPHPPVPPAAVGQPVHPSPVAAPPVRAARPATPIVPATTAQDPRRLRQQQDQQRRLQQEDQRQTIRQNQQQQEQFRRQQQDQQRAQQQRMQENQQRGEQQRMLQQRVQEQREQQQRFQPQRMPQQPMPVHHEAPQRPPEPRLQPHPQGNCGHPGAPPCR